MVSYTPPVVVEVSLAQQPVTGGGEDAGTVTSVGLALPISVFDVGAAVTTAGTLTGTFKTQTANTVFAGPTTGALAAPAFRALVAADIPLALRGGSSFTNTADVVGLALKAHTTQTQNVFEVRNSVDTALLRVSGTGSLLTSGTVSISNTTTSTSTASGALIVSGGAAILENLNVGGKIYLRGSYTATFPNLGTTPGKIHFSPSGANNAVVAITFGGAGANVDTAHAGIYSQTSTVYGTKLSFATTNSFVLGAQQRMEIAEDGKVTILGTIAATSTSTGSLVVAGGVGIQGALFGTAATFSSALEAASLKVTNTAGTGSRMVVADATGNFSTQAIPTTGTTITGTPVTNDTVYYDGTNWVRNAFLQNTGSRVLINGGSAAISAAVVIARTGTDQGIKINGGSGASISLSIDLPASGTGVHVNPGTGATGFTVGGATAYGYKSTSSTGYDFYGDGLRSYFTQVRMGGTAGTPTAQLDVISGSASRIGLIVQAASTPSVNVQEWQDSTGTAQASVSSSFVISGAGFKLATGAGSGKIIQSDASGNFSWVTPTTGVPAGTDTQTLYYNGTTATATSFISHNGITGKIGSGAINSAHTLAIAAGGVQTTTLYIEHATSTAISGRGNTGVYGESFATNGKSVYGKGNAAGAYAFYAESQSTGYDFYGSTTTGRSYIAGQVKIGGTAGTAIGQLDVISGSASRIGLIVQAAATPSVNIQEWQDSTGTAQASISSSFVMNATGYNVAGTTVITTRKLGWITLTGTATRNGSGFATGSITTAELAQVVKGLVDDLMAHGLIGA